MAEESSGDVFIVTSKEKEKEKEEEARRRVKEQQTATTLSPQHLKHSSIQQQAKQAVSFVFLLSI